MGGEAQRELVIRENVPLAPYTTLGIGGPARLFVTASTEAEVAAAVQYAQQRNVPVFVLGGGSNLLVSDGGFDGMVLHVALRGIHLHEPAADGRTRVTAGAGENWDDLVQFTVERGLQGMECLAGIPGSVGGTPVQNVGAYGQEIAATFVSADAYDQKLQQFVELKAAEMGFAYRTSRLNTGDRGRYVLTRITFALVQGGAPELSYADLQRAFVGIERPSLVEVAEQVRTIRRRKGMVLDPADPDTRSAGSFFRNPVVGGAVLQRISRVVGLNTEAIPHWPAGDGQVKLAAAWLLERAGFTRGTALRGAGISSKHTLALINRGGAMQKDIQQLRDAIVTSVLRQFGVRLEQEPVNVGEPG